MVRRKIQEGLEKFVEKFIKGGQMLPLSKKSSSPSGENFQEIFNAFPDPLFILDPQSGFIVDANQQACEMVKYPREELIKGSIDLLSSGERPYTREEALGWLRKASSEGPQTFEWLSKDRENKLLWVEVNLKHCVIRGKERILAASQDKLKLKHAEEALQESEEKFRSIFQYMAAGCCLSEIVYKDDKAVDHRIIDVNPSCEKIIGIPRDKAAGTLASKLYGINEVPFLDVYSLVAKTGQPTSFEAYFPPAEKYLDVLVSSPTKGQFFTIFTDITERKRIEKDLQEREKKFQTVFDQNVQLSALLRSDGTLIAVNKTALHLIRIEESHVIGKPIWETPWWSHSAELQQRLRDSIKKTANGRFDRFEATHQAWDQSIHYIDFLLTPVFDDSGDILFLMAEGRDITERKLAEEGLKKSEENYRSLIENINLGITLVDHDHKIIMTNTGQAKLLHKTVDHFPGKYCFREFENRSEICPHCPGKIAMETGHTAEVESTVIIDDGASLPVHIYAFPTFDQNGKPTGFIEVVEDITERKKAEEALRESEERFRLIAGNIVEVFWMIDITTEKMLYISPAYEHIWGLSSKSLYEKSRSYLEVIHPDDRKRVIDNLKVEKEGKPFELEYRITCPDGTVRWILNRGFPVREENGEVTRYVGVAQDITERRQAEQQMLSLQEQLRQAQKMEAIGRLAGGVAHDFNNLLTVITLQSQLALRGMVEGDPLMEKLKDIQKATERAENLTRQLLAFSRRQILQVKVVNLNFILGSLEKMLRRIIGENIEISTKLSEDLGLVKVDSGQMDQVIVNLAVNAKDAMPEGGKLLFETANIELDEADKISYIGMIPGAYVMLSVTDTGNGMTKEIQEHIFDPFFTTKEKGKGTGLGLSTVYGVVKQSGGDIHVYSEPGKGTTFKIYFPQVFEPMEGFKKEKDFKEIPRGDETILLVEDDVKVRELATVILRTQGYKVLEATDGEDALIICKKEKNPIHLIVTDVVMPKMTGSQLVEQLKNTDRNFKVLFMSGYTDNIIADKGILKEGIDLIQKPFKFESLAKMVREVLDKN